MTDWQPTHAAPDGGLPMWTEHDAALEPVARLQAGTPVSIVQRWGDFAEVLCENDFRAWVDGRHLVSTAPAPIAAPPAPVAAPPPTPAPVAAKAGSRNGVVVAIAVVAAVVIVIAVLATRGGDKKSATSSTAQPVNSNALIALKVPTGWSVDAKGEVAAENAADLTATTPTGPRVRATATTSTDDPVAFMSDALTQSDGELRDNADATTVSGQPALQVTIEQNGLVQRFVVVRPKDKPPVRFVLEAPTARFDDSISLMETVPGLR